MGSNGHALAGYTIEDVLHALEQHGWPETVIMAPKEWLALAQRATILRDDRGPFIMLGPCQLRPKGSPTTVDVSDTGLVVGRVRLVQ